MKKNLTAILLFFIPLNFLLSQNETNNWYFGKYVGLNFASNPPTAITTSTMWAEEGCASLSDPNGNLLFYTDGAVVWNSANVPMANGTGLIGHNSSTQSSLIIKKPGSTNLYYLFTMGQHGLGPLAYSIIDMSLAAGMGSITIKNATLAINTTEKLCGTKHCNGTDYWIMTHGMNNNNFLAYQLSSSGVNTMAIVSSIGSIHAATSASLSYIGCMKFSPNGHRLGVDIFETNGAVELFDFNPATGSVTNSLSLGPNYFAYGCEFSPDGTKFYSSVTDPISQVDQQLVQWDLCAGSSTAIINSRIIVATETYSSNSPGISTLQLAKDGKLYISRTGGVNISTLDHPDLLGGASSYTTMVQALTTAANGMNFGLPNFVSNYFREKPVFNNSITCSSASFSVPVFCSGTGYSVVGQSWSFGDAASGASNTSTLSNPVHLYSNGGTYTAQLILHYDCGSDTLKQVVNVAAPSVSVSGRMTICSKESTKLTVSGADTYSWSSGPTTTTVSYTPTTTTVYTVTGTSTLNSCSSTKVITVSVIPCTGIYNETENEKIISIYPNPNKGLFTLQTLYANTQVVIYDQLGGKVYEAVLTASTQKIDLSDLPAGIYFLNATSNEKNASLKFVKLD